MGGDRHWTESNIAIAFTMFCQFLILLHSFWWFRARTFLTFIFKSHRKSVITRTTIRNFITSSNNHLLIVSISLFFYIHWSLEVGAVFKRKKKKEKPGPKYAIPKIFYSKQSSIYTSPYFMIVHYSTILWNASSGKTVPLYTFNSVYLWIFVQSLAYCVIQQQPTHQIAF